MTVLCWLELALTLLSEGTYLFPSAVLITAQQDVLGLGSTIREQELVMELAESSKSRRSKQYMQIVEQLIKNCACRGSNAQIGTLQPLQDLRPHIPATGCNCRHKQQQLQLLIPNSPKVIMKDYLFIQPFFLVYL